MKLLISTGEVSGDLQGSLLINALKTNEKKRKNTTYRNLNTIYYKFSF